MTEEDKIEFEEKDPLDDSIDPLMSEPFDPVKIQIQPKQVPLRYIIERLEHNEIDMNTDFQRHADLWSPVKMSRLIESILIRFPLPAFYFDASNDDKWLIVDGLQRLSSIRKFVIDKTLELKGLEYLKDLNGVSYDMLPRQYMRRIDECPITMFQIMPGTPPEVKYSIFRRINTGGLVLNNQEIRNALAKPRERNFLEKLTQDEFLIKAVGDQSRRMADQELVLKFIAFHYNNYIESKKNLAVFLDDAMESLAKKTDIQLEEIENIFNNAIETCYSIFGKSAFEKPKIDDDSRKQRKNSSLFEVWMVSVAKLEPPEQKRLIDKRQLVIDQFSALIKNDEFFNSISFSTQKHDHVSIRYREIKKIINEVLHD
ncbi:MAG: DUF262 domain-containing protein [bacterium]|nr:DUF262 domain-containing protein [bacterium]